MDANMETRTKKFFERAMRTSQLRHADYLLRHPEFEDLIRIVVGKIGIDPALIEKDGIMHCLYGLQRQV
jgi:hypothetical protein